MLTYLVTFSTLLYADNRTFGHTPLHSRHGSRRDQVWRFAKFLGQPENPKNFRRRKTKVARYVNFPKMLTYLVTQPKPPPAPLAGRNDAHTTAAAVASTMAALTGHEWRKWVDAKFRPWQPRQSHRNMLH